MNNDLHPLSGEQRYWQAIVKARIISRRNIEAAMRGERADSGECTMDLERRFLIAEFDRLVALIECRTTEQPARPWRAFA
jgi:hypothetical protein